MASSVLTPVASGATSHVEVDVDLSIGPFIYQGSPLGPEVWRSYLVTVTNASEEPVRLGLSVDVRTQDQLEDLWISDFLAPALDPADPETAQLLLDTFAPTVAPGTVSQFSVPDWPGLTYRFSQLDPEPQSILTITSEGTYVRFPDLTLEDGGINVATLSGAELFPGMTATVTASGLEAGAELGVWMAPGLDYVMFLLSGSLLPDGAFEAGRAVVQSDGTYSATVSIPQGTPIGQYQMIVGDPSSRSWPAGSFQFFQVVAPAATATAPTGQGTSVTNSFPIGGSTVSLGFNSVLEGGETTVTASRTGPLPTGFQFAATPPTYFHIDTTASFSGQVQVCMTYDSQSITTPPRLYHFEDGAWSDITTIREAGRVCGTTDSFSPFVLGLPNGVELANKHQCKDGGWRTSTLPPFANQGACVSWFQARGW